MTPRPARLLRLSLFLVLGSLGTTGHALPSVELKVKGTLRPSACTPTLSSDGILDYGIINAAELHARTATMLPMRGITLTIDCSEPANIALKVVDNRAASRTLVSFANSPPNASTTFGLGLASGYRLGGFRISFAAGATADGHPVDSISSPNKGRTWRRTSGFVRHTGYYFSFSRDGLTSSTQKVLNAPLNVHTVINSGPNFPRGDELQLDGSATIEVNYL
jgi:hypothetical protein